MDEIVPGQIRMWRDENPLSDTLSDDGLIMIIQINRDMSTLEELAWDVLSGSKVRFFYADDIVEFSDLVSQARLSS
jgi:hypothetical protein